MQMSRPKWNVFLVVSRAIIIFATAATLRLLEEESLSGEPEATLMAPNRGRNIWRCLMRIQLHRNLYP
jgi:hypothetical protein